MYSGNYAADIIDDLRDPLPERPDPADRDYDSLPDPFAVITQMHNAEADEREVFWREIFAENERQRAEDIRKWGATFDKYLSNAVWKRERSA